MSLSFRVISLLLLISIIPISTTSSSLDLSLLYLGSTNYAVDIYFVGTGDIESSEIRPSAQGTYDLISTRVFTPLTFKFDLTGYSNFSLGVQQVPYAINGSVDLGQSSRTIGSSYIIINGDVQLLEPASYLHTGVKRNLPQGESTVSIIYLGFQDGVVIYEQDSVVVRILPEGNFKSYLTQDYPLNLTYTDSYNGGTFVKDVIQPMENDWLIKVTSYKPTVSLKTSTIDEEGIILSDDNTEFSLDIKSNTSGFAGIQSIGAWDSVQGITLFQDATGLKSMGSSSIAVRNGVNYFGAITFAPYGIWHEDLPKKSTGESGVQYDWEGWVSGIDQMGNESRPDSSFDFAVSSQSLSFPALIENIETVKITETKKAYYYPGYVIFVLPIIYRIIKRRGNHD